MEKAKATSKTNNRVGRCNCGRSKCGGGKEGKVKTDKAKADKAEEAAGSAVRLRQAAFPVGASFKSRGLAALMRLLMYCGLPRSDGLGVSRRSDDLARTAFLVATK